MARRRSLVWSQTIEDSKVRITDLELTIQDMVAKDEYDRLKSELEQLQQVAQQHSARQQHQMAAPQSPSAQRQQDTRRLSTTSSASDTSICLSAMNIRSPSEPGTPGGYRSPYGRRPSTDILRGLDMSRRSSVQSLNSPEPFGRQMPPSPGFGQPIQQKTFGGLINQASPSPVGFGAQSPFG